MLIKRLEALFATAEKFRGAYFFSPPTNAAGRRSYEKYNSIEEFSWTEGGNIYTAEFSVNCSCKNVYAKGIYTKNGTKTTLTAIKNSYRRLLATA